MKNIVISDEYNELDFKPSDLLKHYKLMVEEDVRSYFIKAKNLKKTDCPACNSQTSRAAFRKFGLSYQECGRCQTLFVSPRPDDRALFEFYLKGKARLFWQEKLSQVTNKKRKEKIIQPRFQWILESTQEYFPSARHWVDVNTAQYGYIEEMLNATLFEHKTLLNPMVQEGQLAVDRRVKVINNLEHWDEELDQRVDVVSLFEVADHAAGVDDLFQKIRRILKSGGLCFMTTILASGFDIQVLWEQAENIYPPDRLNVFTVKGLNELVKRHGFEYLEFSTPGILDLEIVMKKMREEKDLQLPRFVRMLIDDNDGETRAAFQDFLQANRLSSYGRICLKKID